MARKRRISDETAAVLSLFLEDPAVQRFGLEIVAEAQLASGSLYPILHRLAEREILQSEWEALEDAVAAGRRPRRLYRLDSKGAETACDLLADWASARSPGSLKRSRLRARPA